MDSDKACFTPTLLPMVQLTLKQLQLLNEFICLHTASPAVVLYQLCQILTTLIILMVDGMTIDISVRGNTTMILTCTLKQ